MAVTQTSQIKDAARLQENQAALRFIIKPLDREAHNPTTSNSPCSTQLLEKAPS
jgi:hypothetical protein